MKNIRDTDLVLSLKSILEDADKGDIELQSHQKETLEDIIERVGMKQEPLAAWFDLECWLYELKQKEKSVEIKSAIAWGALWIVKKTGCIDWDAMRQLYGECMSHLMGLR